MIEDLNKQTQIPGVETVEEALLSPEDVTQAINVIESDTNGVLDYLHSEEGKEIFEKLKDAGIDLSTDPTSETQGLTNALKTLNNPTTKTKLAKAIISGGKLQKLAEFLQ